MKKLLFLLVFFVGCSTHETVIKPRSVEITVPEIKDSITAVFINMSETKIDTLNNIFESLPDSAKFVGIKEIITTSGDKVKVKVAYYPKQNSFTIDIPSYKIDTTITDTTTIVIHKKTFFEKIEIYFYIVMVILSLIFIYKIYRFKND